MQRACLREIANDLHISISRLKRRVRDASDQGAISGPELRTLSRLDRLGPSTTAELARQEQITPQAMGATVSALLVREYVARAADPSDGRRVILTLTKSGRRALTSGRGVLTDRLTAALGSSFSDDEIELLRKATPLIDRLTEQF